MGMTDPIADMLTRIRNAISARHDRVDMPSSKLKINIAKLMKDEGYILNYRIIKENGKDVLRIALKYVDKNPIILGLKRISKPGRRIYCSHNKLPTIRGGLGIAVISTSKGILTDVQAKNNKVGGELLCAIW
ncbi:MAG: 30S ribosomal protein S8 [Dissulfurimicrobium sp.]|uniref:30S ribosomal protein S8 n=1 Tax=Dissulfurimicrobium TaxID=1769732 RepID=UPI001EDB4A36|nr:30S ribosomal protein S8 [Dissulfurimicrobium hydrothermale]UKL14333.1 30S ribosomal protein S8 [Dissulfurimicrobium hydrothermale]